METLAFIHAAVDYEDSTPVELRSIDEITSAIPTSAIMGVAGAAVAIGVLTQAPDAEAALRRGNVCSAVSTLQSTLQRNGYSVGGVDGAFGNNTEFAVKQFQRNNGLARDGIVGPATAGTMGLNPSISCAGSGGPGGGNPGNSGSGALVRVTARSGLNIRSGPSTGNSVIGSLPYNAVVRVRVSDRSSSFAQLLNGGWISSQYITDASSNPGNGGGVGGGSPARVVAGIGVKIRSGPGLGYARIGGAGYGETLRLTGERVSRDGYRWAKLSGQAGWVATAGLNVN
ncbi:peptidoglycan-binding protein [Microcoleus sp. FACHB-1515]|uniref:peptidoglycan-binding protein n=1 Tax=Cyanophyceae TaxID=3028117 RepID=UPI0016844797|nr:peptidoglycan-binding protein [Microcoleus sp. FACHB-1515]MBD2088872.1 peptidoglycan-binding protein [Microcoleus sp. FACHB-1515]